jgi:hypothetical protein
MRIDPSVIGIVLVGPEIFERVVFHDTRERLVQLKGELEQYSIMKAIVNIGSDIAAKSKRHLCLIPHSGLQKELTNPTQSSLRQDIVDYYNTRVRVILVFSEPLLLYLIGVEVFVE